MDQILILHAPDAHERAKKLAHELDVIGFVAITFGGISRRSTRSQMVNARPELFDETPAIILLGSAQLFAEDYYLETALLSLVTKVVIFVLYDEPIQEYPAWFTYPIILKDSKKNSEREWNKLIQCLLYLTGPF